MVCELGFNFWGPDLDVYPIFAHVGVAFSTPTGTNVDNF